MRKSRCGSVKLSFDEAHKDEKLTKNAELKKKNTVRASSIALDHRSNNTKPNNEGAPSDLPENLRFPAFIRSALPCFLPKDLQ